MAAAVFCRWIELALRNGLAFLLEIPSALTLTQQKLVKDFPGLTPQASAWIRTGNRLRMKAQPIWS